LLRLDERLLGKAGKNITDKVTILIFYNFFGEFFSHKGGFLNFFLVHKTQKLGAFCTGLKHFVIFVFLIFFGFL